jgi:hypothetical protein
MDAAAIAAAQRALSNNATHSLTFQAPLPPLGWATFHVAAAKVGAPGAASLSRASGAPPGAAAAKTGTSAIGQERVERRRLASGSITNGAYTVGYDEASGLVTTLTNERTKVTTPFKVDWGFYKSSEGGCTGGVNATTGAYDYRLYGCDAQKSGAYIFRPNSTTLYACSAAKPTLTVRRDAAARSFHNILSLSRALSLSLSRSLSLSLSLSLALSLSAHSCCFCPSPPPLFVSPGRHG